MEKKDYETCNSWGLLKTCWISSASYQAEPRKKLRAPSVCSHAHSDDISRRPRPAHLSARFSGREGSWFSVFCQDRIRVQTLVSSGRTCLAQLLELTVTCNEVPVFIPVAASTDPWEKQ